MSNFQITPLDLNFQGRPQAIAAFLVRGPGAPVLVETGPGSTLPALLQGLAQHDLAPGDIRDVLLTHIHLDHAGAAGTLVREHPGLRVHVSEIGAPHVVDPSRLDASARRLYGDAFDVLISET